MSGNVQSCRPGSIVGFGRGNLSRRLLLLPFLFILLADSWTLGDAAGVPAKPTFTHVHQNADGTLTATIESPMHCNYSGCIPSTGACCTHTAWCGCGCAAGWSGSRCDHPSDWTAEHFHYNFTFRQKIPVPRWSAALGDNGLRIGPRFQDEGTQ